MYAIIKTGGKQYRVQKGDIIQVELLAGKSEGPVDFDNVLFVNDGKAVKIGTPVLADCKVKGALLARVKGPKVIAYKYKRRKNYRRKVGHRQKYSQVKIVDIVS